MKPRYFYFFLLPICFISALVFAEDENFDKIVMQAEKGNVSAQFILGIMYFKGQGASQDYNEAFKWFQKAAEQGLPEAQYNIGEMYYQGKGVSLNYVEAHKWFNKAA
jgi:TPR repeat protein